MSSKCLRRPLAVLLWFGLLFMPVVLTQSIVPSLGVRLVDVPAGALLPAYQSLASENSNALVFAGSDDSRVVKGFGVYLLILFLTTAVSLLGFASSHVEALGPLRAGLSRARTGARRVRRSQPSRTRRAR